MTKALLYAASNTRTAYNQHLEAEKKKRQDEDGNPFLWKLKTKNYKLESCTRDLLKSADSYAGKTADLELHVKICKGQVHREIKIGIRA